MPSKKSYECSYRGFFFNNYVELGKLFYEKRKYINSPRTWTKKKKKTD